MKLIIFGGCGFIGTNIALKAVERGYGVIVFDSLVRAGTEENLKVLKDKVEFIRGDVRNYEDFWRIGKVDAAINLAANPGIPWSIENPLFDFKTNALGALNILEFSKNNGKFPVIQASTNKVYSDEVNEIPLNENKTRYSFIDKFKYGIAETFPIDAQGRHPHSPYGCSKIAADMYFQEYFHLYGIPTVINRMSCIYGLYQKGVADQGWVDHFVRKALGDGKIDIYGDGKQVRDMLYGGDVAELYLMEIEKIDVAKGKVFNVGGSNYFTISLIESIRLIEELTGRKTKLTYHDWRHADQRVYISDIRKVESVMGWKPKTDIKTGLQNIIKQYVLSV
jgi:CDP-paratose 2-epimerase